MAANNGKAIELDAPKGKPDKGAKKPGNTLRFDRNMYMWWFENMLLQRRFEEKAGQLYGQQKIKGFCHLYIGQEACSAGTKTALTKDDKYITAYRDHGLPLALGTHPNAIMAELFAKNTGSSRGKGGSMHIFDKEVNFVGGHGIVGAQVPMAAGLAFAEQYNGTKNLAIGFMGDGAVRQGAFHEALNMAMLWKLPVARAAERARSGNGPTLLEFRTYRFKGHSMSDPAKYRTKEELETYRLQDPIESVRQTILTNKFATEQDLEDIDMRIKAEVQASVEFAENSPYPSPEEAYQDVYVGDYPFILE